MKEDKPPAPLRKNVNMSYSLLKSVSLANCVRDLYLCSLYNVTISWANAIREMDALEQKLHFNLFPLKSRRAGVGLSIHIFFWTSYLKCRRVKATNRTFFWLFLLALYFLSGCKNTRYVEIMFLFFLQDVFILIIDYWN